MEDEFKIFVEQLRSGHVEKIDETVDSSFLDLKEEELKFCDKTHVKGEAYLAENELIIRLDVDLEVSLPCAICNKPVTVPLHLHNLYLTPEPEEYKSGIFHFGELLRESILLEIPHFVECNGGKCPQRKEISHYLRNPEEADDHDGGYRPFADLDFDDKAK